MLGQAKCSASDAAAVGAGRRLATAPTAVRGASGPVWGDGPSAERRFALAAIHQQAAAAIGLAGAGQGAVNPRLVLALRLDLLGRRALLGSQVLLLDPALGKERPPLARTLRP